MMYGTGISRLFSLFTSFIFLPITMLMGLWSFNGSSYGNYEYSFEDYVTKFYTAAENQYLADSTLGTGNPKECYNIEELGLSKESIGDFKGYVCFHSSNNPGDKIQIYVSLKNDKYTTFTKVGNETYNYINYTEYGEPKLSKSDSLKDNEAYYVDVNTKINKKLTVIDGKPTNNYDI
ncbi:MAG: hypothetical protein K6E99_02155 [Bacilli bacterium]|nr:hypothetical protein [Bacilli bacterium]